MLDVHHPDEIDDEHLVRHPDLDLGDNHTLQFFAWEPDRSCNPQYAGIPDIPKCGAGVRHLKPDGVTPCEGCIMFDIPGVAAAFPTESKWKVDAWEPLTLSPSLFCNPAKGGCGDHGFIKSGRWVKA